MYMPQKQMLVDGEGNFTFTVTEDNTEHAKTVQDIKETSKGWTEGRTRKLRASIPPFVYQKYARELGQECWQDENFLQWLKMERPEFFT